MTTEIKNAVIKSASLSTADHGLLSSFIHLDYGGSGQGFGGFCLYSPSAHPNDAVNIAGLWIWRTLEIAGVSDWADLPGRPVRVKGGHNSIEAIGHILKDEWFNASEEFKALSGEK